MSSFGEFDEANPVDLDVSDILSDDNKPFDRGEFMAQYSEAFQDAEPSEISAFWQTVEDMTAGGTITEREAVQQILSGNLG